MKKYLLILLIIGLFVSNSNSETTVGGLFDIVFTNSDEADITNRTFRGFSNFHTSRTRIFFDSYINENMSAFAQILFDGNSTQLYGAYVNFSNLKGKSLNINLGLIPHPVGTFGPRTYSNKNPLIGNPLLYNMHTKIDPINSGALRSNDDFIAHDAVQPAMGMPIIYDACWNSGIDFFGYYKNLDYSLALVTGSLSKPTQEQKKNSPMATTHLSYNFSPGLIFGVSAYYGQYLYEGLFKDAMPAGKEPGDFLSSGIGYDFYFAKNRVEIYSEAFFSSWEYPYLSEKLNAITGYAEVKFTFYPSWYIAGRLDSYMPGELTNSSGQKVKWDTETSRYEFGIGHKPDRNVVIKLVVQFNRFDRKSSYDEDHFALQTSIMF